MVRDSSLCIILVSISILAWLSACDGNLLAGNCSESDREALIDFKNGLQGPYNGLSSWQGSNCCWWQGIGCDERTRGVISIDLRGDSSKYGYWKLSGEIRPSLARLKSLRFLDLSSNNFVGVPIPEFIGSLENLRYLNLSSARFDGAIPPNLGNLSNLQYLDLSSCYSLSTNNLGWISGLGFLKYLALDGADLSMVSSVWINVLNGIPSLSGLHLSRCGLSGSISLPGLVNFTSLAVLDLSSNSLNSVFPQWLVNVSSLVSVAMSGSGLYGRIPLGLGELPRLQILILNGNINLSASCTQLFQGSWKRIEVMDLADNKIHGRLPSSIGKMTTLSDFDLSQNLVRGGIPSSMGSLCSLVNFDLSNNNLTGSLPEILQRGSETCDSQSSLPNLRHLRLRYSGLRGCLPSWMGQLKNLEELILDHNFLEGPIPSLGNLKNLTYLGLRGNRLNGSLPIDIGQLSEWGVFDVAFNYLSGTLSEEHFANLRKIKDLYLSSNSFTLNVSANWMPPFQVRDLGMGSCQMGPAFPAWLRYQNGISSLDFSNANISGDVPSWFWDISSNLYLLNMSLNWLQGQLPNPLPLATDGYVDLSSNLFRGPVPLPISMYGLLDLSNNQFSGGIPQNLSKYMRNLDFLALSSNRITGGLPESIGEMQSLRVINVANNHLSGSIPPSIGNCSYLEVLDLQNNSLFGLIPASLGQLQWLQSLHLSHNKLSGNLPSSFKNLSRLETLDIGNNQLNGTIPAWMAEGFINLRILSLRSNAFFGAIPHELSSLSSLQVLDLAENNLTGKIPSSFGDLKAMVKRQEKNEYLFYGMASAGTYYEENFLVTTKGQRLSYSKTLSLVTCIDISGNNLDGEFPEEMTKLGGLLILNLSRNGIGGWIPKSISSMSQLLSLDLSSNKLSGAIPQSMSSLSFLSYLNLSDNNFSGKIPYTQQMTTFSNSSYSGNLGLCGAPLNVTCPADESDKPGTTEDGGGDDEFIDQWFYLSVGLGYAAGILVPAVVLHIKSSWADPYFDFIDRIAERWLSIGNKRTKLRRNRQRGRR